MIDSTTKLHVNILQCSIRKGDLIQLTINDFDAREFTSVSYDISKIDDDYTYWVFSSSSNLVCENNTIKINCNLNNQLENGLYLISRLRFTKPMPQGTGQGPVPPGPNDEVSYNFKNFGFFI